MSELCLWPSGFSLVWPTPEASDGDDADNMGEIRKGELFVDLGEESYDGVFFKILTKDRVGWVFRWASVPK